MSELEKKFKEYFKNIDMVNKPLKAIVYDLAEIAEKDYEEKLIATDHNVHRMPHKFKHFELFGQEIEELRKSNKELAENLEGRKRIIVDLYNDLSALKKQIANTYFLSALKKQIANTYFK